MTEFDPDSAPSEDEEKTSEGITKLFPAAAGLLLIVGIVVLLKRGSPIDEDASIGPKPFPAEVRNAPPQKRYAGNYSAHAGFTNIFNPSNEVTLWWSKVPEEIIAARVDTGTNSNIRRADYTGPAACATCHKEKFDSWTGHAHRWMHSEATPSTVKGDFSGNSDIRYQGGVGTFFKDGDAYRMKLVRGDRVRLFSVTRTIGSRFFQYYVGRLLEGSPADSQEMRETEHVLPFGYWIDVEEWVPTVHVYRETDFYDDARDVYTDNEVAPYDSGCSVCHVTQPVGDWLSDKTGGKRLSAYAPRSTAFDLAGYLVDQHPELLPQGRKPMDLDVKEGDRVRDLVASLPFAEHGVAFGITCEACHHGSRAHVEASTPEQTSARPAFSPVSPFVHSADKDLEAVTGRSGGNLNLICARCHSGGRKPFANGIHTWNSTEFTDASEGYCFTRGPGSNSERRTLTCVHCHDPHEGIGAKWKPSPAEDNAKCIDCHDRFKNELVLTAHTHHAPSSTGSECMNCHMPKITEGLQEMVRTHRIFSPTDRQMIEGNQPNACNLCHLEKPIDWTIGHLRDWFGQGHRYDERKLTVNYPNRRGSVALGWLQSAHHPTRLVAAEFLSRDAVSWAIAPLMKVLADDSNIINRQFTQRRLEEKFGLRLKDLGYQFYASEAERRLAVERMSPQLARLAAKVAAAN